MTILLEVRRNIRRAVTLTEEFDWIDELKSDQLAHSAIQDVTVCDDRHNAEAGSRQDLALS